MNALTPFVTNSVCASSGWPFFPDVLVRRFGHSLVRDDRLY